MTTVVGVPPLAYPETVKMVIMPSATRAGAAAGAIHVPRYEMKTKVIEIQLSFTSASTRKLGTMSSDVFASVSGEKPS